MQLIHALVILINFYTENPVLIVTVKINFQQNPVPGFETELGFSQRDDGIKLEVYSELVKHFKAFIPVQW